MGALSTPPENWPNLNEPDDPKATKVTAFTLSATSLQLTITRDGADAYVRNKPTPNPADIPPDYLAALTSWIARNLR